MLGASLEERVLHSAVEITEQTSIVAWIFLFHETIL